MANDVGSTPKLIALAWLLRSANILVITGTSSPTHLHENFVVAAPVLSEEHVRSLIIFRDTLANDSSGREVDTNSSTLAAMDTVLLDTEKTCR